jgi:hypothetical protein
VKRLFSIYAGILALRLRVKDSTIRTTVPLVAMPTSVTEKSGNVIEGLRIKDKG